MVVNRVYLIKDVQSYGELIGVLSQAPPVDIIDEFLNLLGRQEVLFTCLTVRCFGYRYKKRTLNIVRKNNTKQ